MRLLRVAGLVVVLVVVLALTGSAGISTALPPTPADLSAAAPPGVITVAPEASAPRLQPLRPARPPRNDATGRDLVVTQAFVTTTVDSDRDGRRDVVRVVVTRPRPGLVDGRRLATVATASPYYSCCKDVANHDVDVPLGGPRAETEDSMLSGLRSQGAFWARRGYAYARVASLGSNQSTGCPTIGDDVETAGVVALVDWLNGRAVARTRGGDVVRPRFATGNVGLVGTSYDGTLPNMAAATGVEGLRAIVPLSAISSWYDYYRQDGLVVAPGGYQGEDADILAEFDYTRADQDVCDPVVAELEAEQDRRTGDYSRFWNRRNLLPHADRVRAGVLIGHGFGDTNVKPSQAARWYAALRDAGVPTKIWWDQGGHGTPLPQRLVNRWFDHFLYGVRNGAAGGPSAAVVDERGEASWHRTWPRPGSRLRGYALRAGSDGVGSLRPGDRGSDRRLSFTDDARLSAADVCAGPPTPHALTFSTGPLPRGLDLSGTPTARLRLGFDRPAANVTAALCVTVGDSSRLLTQGWADPQNHRSLRTSAPLRPGRTYRVDVRLQPLDQRLPPGARVSLAVMSSDHDFTLRPPAGTRLGLDLRGSGLRLPVVR